MTHPPLSPPTKSKASLIPPSKKRQRKSKRPFLPPQRYTGIVETIACCPCPGERGLPLPRRQQLRQLRLALQPQRKERRMVTRALQR